MSQETGLWSVRRPRETLGSINLNSGLPQPPSAMKRGNTTTNSVTGAGGPSGSFSGGGGHQRSMSGSRQSLALGLSKPQGQGGFPQPNFQRSSSSGGGGNNEMGLQSVKRSSFQSGGGGSRGPGRASEERRSSVYRSRGSAAGGGGGMMMGIGPSSQLRFFHQTPAPAGVPKDPRPLKDRAYQTRIGQELLDYLSQNNFEMEMKHTLSQNITKSPTQKDFNFMFQWLYHRIDPSYHFQRSIDQEVPPILKQLRYPYEKSITKSQLAAVGGQNWSTFLGLLHWMMQLCRMLDGFSAHVYDEAAESESGVDVNRDRIVFDFLSNSYRAWLSVDDEAGQDDVDRVLAPHVRTMADAVEQADARHREELRVLEAEAAQLQAALAEAEAAVPNPATLDEHHKIMREDRAKFLEYIGAAQARSDKYEARAAVLREELDRASAELVEAEEERRQLQRLVDDQGIAMQDIDRMTAERERLQRGLESAAGRLDEAKRKVAEREADAARRLEELERLADAYNSLAYQIGLIPATAANARGRDYELKVLVDSSGSGSGGGGGGGFNGLVDGTAALNLNSSGGGGDRLTADAGTGWSAAHVLSLDLRGATRAALAALRKEVSERRAVAMEAMLKDHELLDGIREAIEDKRGEVAALEHRVRAAEEEYDKTKEVTTAQKMASDAQIEKMEKELAKMRAAVSESVQLMEQREMNTNIEYEQLTLKAAALREELHTAVERILNDVVKFKVHVQRNLEEYESFVADEVDGEEAAAGGGLSGGAGEDDATRGVDM